jgi:hypothetical protein
MATVTSITVVPHTRIDNSIIANMADIGVYCYAVFSAIKMHLNQATGACFPSYATIARITGIHRSTVIACVKKLRSLKLVDPRWRFKEDGSHASNQYTFQAPGKVGAANMPGREHAGAATSQGAGTSAPSQEVDKPIQTSEGSRPARLPVVGQDDHPSRPQRPEQAPSLNKTKGTSPGASLPTEKPPALVPTDKQHTCPHPPSEIASLTEENLRICHHCWGLLDENLTLITTGSTETEVPDTLASAECESGQPDEPETKQPPAGNIFAKTDTQTPVGIPCKRHQSAPNEGKTAGMRNPLVMLGRLLTGALKAS